MWNWTTARIGMHSIKERPVVVNGQIVIRPIMVVALTYDHRLLDGREAVTFLGASSFILDFYLEFLHFLGLHPLLPDPTECGILEKLVGYLFGVCRCGPGRRAPTHAATDEVVLVYEPVVRFLTSILFALRHRKSLMSYHHCHSRSSCGRCCQARSSPCVACYGLPS